MKKQNCNCKAVITLTFALCLGMTACNAKQETESQQQTQTTQAMEKEELQITIEQMIEANSTEKLLSHHHSVYEDSITMKRYVESELRYYIEDGNKEEIQTPDTVYGLYDGQYWGQIMPGGVWNDESDYYAYLGVNPDLTILEKIKKIEDNGDTLMIYTVLPSDSLSDVKDSLEIDYKDGDFIECTYKLDVETLELLETKSVQCHTDGTKDEPLITTITYDTLRPKGALALLERLSNPENLRTITMIFNPDTAEERTEKISVPKGEGVRVSNVEDKAAVFYKDSACTDVYTGGADPNEDMTVYVQFE